MAVSSRTREKIEAAAAEIGAQPYVHDTLDLDAAPELLDSVERDLGPIDILVTNTGGPPGGDPLEFTRDQWEAAHRELVVAPIEMIERGRARDARALLRPHRERVVLGRARADPDADAVELAPARPPGRLQDARPQARGRRHHAQHDPAGPDRHGSHRSPSRVDRGGREGRARRDSRPAGSGPQRRSRPPRHSCARSARATSPGWPCWWTAASRGASEPDVAGAHLHAQPGRSGGGLRGRALRVDLA